MVAAGRLRVSGRAHRPAVPSRCPRLAGSVSAAAGRRCRVVLVLVGAESGEATDELLDQAPAGGGVELAAVESALNGAQGAAPDDHGGAGGGDGHDDGDRDERGHGWVLLGGSGSVTTSVAEVSARTGPCCSRFQDLQRIVSDYLR